MSTLSQAEAAAFLYREALFLDTGDYDAWLALYTADCLFWMPAWRDELEPTQDPETELSLIYYDRRANLEERVWRVRSGQSVASTPLPRCVHAVTNVLVEEDDRVSASFTVHLYDVRAVRSHVFFGRYQYRLRRVDDEWRIAAKTILLLNDTIPTVVDFYAV